ncbi:MAG: penicillin-binding transpeptidase domain-containing protein [Patescibacteria group bacterium]
MVFNFRKKKQKPIEIYPDEIFLDSKNIPQFDVYQFEGRIEKPIGKRTFITMTVFFIMVGIFFVGELFSIQILEGKTLRERSEKNSLRIDYILANRGIIFDRNGETLAWNEPDARLYIDWNGLSHVLGYVGLPSEEDLQKIDNLPLKQILGKDGIEKRYNDILGGKPGMKIVETDVENNIISESIQNHPEEGKNIKLTIDAKLQSQFFNIMESVMKDRGFHGGSGIIINVNNGEILSLVSCPEYDSEILSKGEPEEKIMEFLNDANKPFLNRVIAGLYAPGSIIKPLIAIAALNENIISSQKQIFSAGYISIPNPFFPDKQSIFKDWKTHGWIDMRKAIAVSSDVYFYEIGGGFEEQRGLGIKKIEDYTKLFGLDSLTGVDLYGEEIGIVPNPDLKEKFEPNDPIWRIGDTYNASIGQGYFQVTPVEMAIYASAIANKGKIIKPHLILEDNIQDYTLRSLNISEDYFNIIHEGMRLSVKEGTASALNVFGAEIAAKTGTAEIGAGKKYVNSWVIGFFPYDHPQYAFAVVMEKGPSANLVGSPYVIRQLIDWMTIYTPQYLK